MTDPMMLTLMTTTRSTPHCNPISAEDACYRDEGEGPGDGAARQGADGARPAEDADDDDDEDQDEAKPVARPSTMDYSGLHCVPLLLLVHPARPLVNSSMPHDEMPGGTTPCRRPRCNTCKHTVNDGAVTGSSGRRYNIGKAFTCTSTHVIYAIGCKRHPGILYIGETKRQLADRFREHRRDVIRKLTKPVPQHFCSSGHNISDATITALVQVYGMQDRRVAEQNIIFQLRTMWPHGMNIKFDVFHL